MHRQCASDIAALLRGRRHCSFFLQRRAFAPGIESPGRRGGVRRPWHGSCTIPGVTRQTHFDPRWGRRGGAYVVVADGGRARIFKRTGRRFTPQLLEIEHLERATARRHARELTTDLTGRVFGTGIRVGFGPRVMARHGAQSDYDPHAVEVERFARRLSARLVRLATIERIEELVLIAEPRFLGILRRELAPLVRQAVTRELSRNLTGAMLQPIARAAFA